MSSQKKLSSIPGSINQPSTAQDSLSWQFLYNFLKKSYLNQTTKAAHYPHIFNAPGRPASPGKIMAEVDTVSI